MPKASLTDISIKSLARPANGQTDYWDASFKAGAFACRVSQGGSRTFLIKHDNRRITIGRYPAISLAQARTEAKRLLAEFTLGKLKPRSISYAEAVEEFLAEKGKSKRTRTVGEYQRLLKRLAFKGQLTDVTDFEAQRVLSKFKAPSEYNHLLTAAKVFWHWCIKRRLATQNPFDALALHARPPRKRILTDEELVAVWKSCSGEFGNLVRLCILIGQRRGELAQALPAWKGNKTLTIPPEVAKNSRQNTVPLTAYAQQFFTAPYPKFDWGAEKRVLDEASGVTGWTLHDLRRTFKTNLSRLKVMPHISERILNHISARDPLEDVYDLHTFLPEMEQAILLWQTKVISLVR